MFLSGVTGSIRVDGKPAGKKTTTAPIIADGRSSKCKTAEYCPRIGNCIIYTKISRRTSVSCPHHWSSQVLLHKFRADLFVFLFVWCDLDLRIPLSRFRPIWMRLVGIDQVIIKTFYASLWPDESAFSCHCCLLIIYSSQMPTSFSYV